MRQCSVRKMLFRHPTHEVYSDEKFQKGGLYYETKLVIYKCIMHYEGETTSNILRYPIIQCRLTADFHVYIFILNIKIVYLQNVTFSVFISRWHSNCTNSQETMSKNVKFLQLLDKISRTSFLEYLFKFVELQINLNICQTKKSVYQNK